MVTMSRRAPPNRSASEISLSEIAAYVKDPAVFEAVKSELVNLEEQARVAIAEAVTKNDAANERLRIANDKGTALILREKELNERDAKLSEDRGKFETLSAAKLAGLAQEQREAALALGEANKREQEAAKALVDSKVAIDRANREIALAEAARKKIEGRMAAMKAVMDGS
jgi:hypothetical protein